jgi:hypothetical protein
VVSCRLFDTKSEAAIAIAALTNTIIATIENTFFIFSTPEFIY